MSPSTKFVHWINQIILLCRTRLFRSFHFQHFLLVNGFKKQKTKKTWRLCNALFPHADQNTSWSTIMQDTSDKSFTRVKRRYSCREDVNWQHPASLSQTWIASALRRIELSTSWNLKFQFVSLEGDCWNEHLFFYRRKLKATKQREQHDKE